MRLSSIFVILGAFVLAMLFSVVAAGFSVQIIESSASTGVRQELDKQGLVWADADTNGLQVFLMGTAPTEAARFEALSAAGRVVDAARVIDQMNVAEAAALEPPRFSLEMLRNDAGLSLIGLMPKMTDRERFVGRILLRIGAEVPVSDFMEVADFPEPEGWRESLDFAVLALRDLPRSKISVEAGRVTVKAMADSPAARDEIAAELTRRAAPDVALDLQLTAPRPVITPFSLRFLLDQGVARFDACSADSPEAQSRILAAAAAAGAEDTECVIGLGVPTGRWSEAAALGINALAQLQGGSLTFADADISLIAAMGTPQPLFDQVIGELENALPEVFVLHAVLPKPVAADTQEAGPPEFVATLSPEGDVQLRGRIDSEISRQSIDSYARAQFGSDGVHTAARVDSALSQAWSLRVLAALQALSHLSNGVVTVTPDDLALSGNTGNEEARAEIAGLLSEKLGEGAQFDLKVTYVEALDPVKAIPTPQQCADKITEIIGDRKITFEPGSAKLDESANDIMDELAELLKICGALPLEIAGHTDSQGRETMNLNLSQSRAQAVLDALSNRRVLTKTFRARGYGEAQPIADNGTEEGREANRRIEFTLIDLEAEAAEAAANAEQEPSEGDEAAPEEEKANE
ncbi:MAG: OmpA family protein [Rhodobacteraceae bacterium]|nr:OmpA family protein [Paracoccaceae bacterium]